MLKMSKGYIEVVGGGLFGLIMAAVLVTWQTIIVVAVLYGICLFANLATGLLYAKQSNSYSEEVAKHATYKKLGMAIAIACLFIVDLIIMGLARSAGIVYNIPLLGCILAGYAAVHEFMSMLQNLKKLGNNVPAAIEIAAQKAEEALNQGKIPDLNVVLGKKDENETTRD
jgi:hypothetical protein